MIGNRRYGSASISHRCVRLPLQFAGRRASGHASRQIAPLEIHHIVRPHGHQDGQTVAVSEFDLFLVPLPGDALRSAFIQHQDVRLIAQTVGQTPGRADPFRADVGKTLVPASVKVIDPE